jgi:hypothetical protein
MPQMLVALDFDLSEPRQIVIAGKKDAPETKALLRGSASTFSAEDDLPPGRRG